MNACDTLFTDVAGDCKYFVIPLACFVRPISQYSGITAEGIESGDTYFVSGLAGGAIVDSGGKGHVKHE
jgi:hypothetical protein